MAKKIEAGKSGKSSGGNVTDIAHAHAKKPLKPRITRSPELLAIMFDRVSKGESLDTICSTPDMPSRKSFFAWCMEDPESRSGYELALEMKGEFYAEQIVEISDRSSDDWKQDEKGRMVPDTEHIMRSKLRVDARKWVVSKLLPKKYGDKLDITQTVKNADLSDEELLLKFNLIKSKKP